MRRLVFSMVALTALVASSCGGWRQDDAARVNGAGIDADQLNDDVRVLLGEPAVSEVVLGTGGSLLDPSVGGEAGAPEGRLPTAALASLLERRILQALAEEELAARGIEMTDADLAAAEATLREQLRTGSSSSAPSEAGQSGQADPGGGFDALPAGLRDRLVRSDAAVARLRRELAGEELRDFPADAQAFYDENQDQFEEFCLAVVPVADEAEGRRLAAESASGQVALNDLMSRQRGTPAGCGLGYQLREDLLPELGRALEAAPVGRVVGPYAASDGRQILVGVSSRTPQAYGQVQGDVARRYRAERSRLEEGPWTTWLDSQQPEVSVDPRYGSWDAEARAVRPPDGTRTSLPEVRL